MLFLVGRLGTMIVFRLMVARGENRMECRLIKMSKFYYERSRYIIKILL